MRSESPSVVLRVDAALVKRILKLINNFKVFKDRKAFIDSAILEKLEREEKILERARG